MEEYLIETRGLTKQYGSQTAVQDLDLQLRPGHIYGLLGRNGAGKTTTMKMLLGLTRPTRGEVFLFGQPLAGREKALPPDRLNRVLYENGLTILELHQCEDTLEDYFRQITGGEGIGWAASLRIPQAAPHPAAAAAGAGRPVAGERHGGAGRLFLGRFGRAAVQPVAVPPPESAVRRDSPLALGSRAGPVF